MFLHAYDLRKQGHLQVCCVPLDLTRTALHQAQKYEYSIIVPKSARPIKQIDMCLRAHTIFARRAASRCAASAVNPESLPYHAWH